MSKSDLGPLPERHPRTVVCDHAEADLRRMLMDWTDKWSPELTTAEFLRTLHGMFSEKIARFYRSMVRQERHDNTDKPGDQA